MKQIKNSFEISFVLTVRINEKKKYFRPCKTKGKVDSSAARHIDKGAAPEQTPTPLVPRSQIAMNGN